jgi:hypothetical protein
MGASLSAGEIGKLSKLMAMFNSNMEGERTAALDAATRLLNRNQIKWPEVLTATHVRITPRITHGIARVGQSRVSLGESHVNPEPHSIARRPITPARAGRTSQPQSGATRSYSTGSIWNSWTRSMDVSA